MNDENPQIEIRRARSADAKLVSTLGTVTFFEAYFEQDDPRDLADYLHESFNLDKVRAELDDANCEFYVVYRGACAVGYAKLRTGPPPDGVTTTDNSIELQRIYLVERVFGKGVGEVLLKFCLDRARTRGFASVWLGVWQENPRAIRFYEKHGFRKVGEITFPYGATVGRNWVMEKVL